MTKKPLTLTQQLGVELAHIDSALIRLELLLATDKKALDIVGELQRCQQRAFDHLCTIQVALKGL